MLMFPRGEQQQKLKLHLRRNPENLLFQENTNASANFLVVQKKFLQDSKGHFPRSRGEITCLSTAAPAILSALPCVS